MRLAATLLPLLFLPAVSLGQNPVDCNSNGFDDKFDIRGGGSADCNGNGIPDECDIASGVSSDTDANGVPDACDDPPVAIEVELFASGFADPLWVGAPAGDFTRLFVLEQFTGLIKVVEAGVVLPTPFLDLGALIFADGQHGLLGLAFHPNYMTNGRFWLSYSGLGGEMVIAEYSVSEADPNVADTSLVSLLFTHPMTSIHHYGGGIAFGPDGMLYVGVGDDDLIVHSQFPDSYLGKMLRFDIDRPAPHIPLDNPFVGQAPWHPEIWAYGLRNPWRFSFDRATGDLWIGDPGAASREELDFQPAASTGAENYAWPCMEGDHCLTTFGCTCLGPTLALPAFAYAQNSGNCAVIGGFVYRGAAIPELDGTYFYGDHCGGRVWSLRRDAVGGISEFHERTAQVNGPYVLFTSFGEDAAGELYLVAREGNLWKVVAGCEMSEVYCAATVNSTGAVATIGYNGSTSVSANDFVLEASQTPIEEFGIFYYGTAQSAVPFGDGLRCVAGFTARLVPAVQSNASGVATLPLDNTNPPDPLGQISAGSTWNFQYWFRDPLAGMAGFNLSEAISIAFCP